METNVAESEGNKDPNTYSHIFLDVFPDDTNEESSVKKWKEDNLQKWLKHQSTISVDYPPSMSPPNAGKFETVGSQISSREGELRRRLNEAMTETDSESLFSLENISPIKKGEKKQPESRKIVGKRKL